MSVGGELEGEVGMEHTTSSYKKKDSIIIDIVYISDDHLMLYCHISIIFLKHAASDLIEM